MKSFFMGSVVPATARSYRDMITINYVQNTFIFVAYLIFSVSGKARVKQRLQWLNNITLQIRTLIVTNFKKQNLAKMYFLVDNFSKICLQSVGNLEKETFRYNSKAMASSQKSGKFTNSNSWICKWHSKFHFNLKYNSF